MRFSKNNWIKLSIPFLFFFIFLLIILVSFYLFFDLPIEGVQENDRTDFNKYQIYRFNPSTNKSSSGLVTIKKILEDNEYIFYQDEEFGNQVLISNVGSSEYVCSGTCFCGNNRRSSTTAGLHFTRGLTYLVAAVSSLIAVEKAKEYFRNECWEVMKGECSDDIQTEILGCEATTISKPSDSGSSSGEEDLYEHLGDYDKEFRKYKCTANCLFNSDLRDPESVAFAKNFNCPEWKVEHEIKVDVTDMVETQIMEHVRWKFESENVLLTCHIIGRDLCFYKFPGKNRKPEWKEIYCCVGAYNDEVNPSIKCRQTSETIVE